VNTTCRSCNAAIFWARSEYGKRTPIDAAPHPEGNLVVVGGTARVLRKGQAAPEGVLRYRSHFATCPERQLWRKAR